LKATLKEMEWAGVQWTRVAQERSCKHGKEQSVSRKYG